ncbi:MAG: hypothetical protein GF411_14270 [Candidatus Lokiarchaeota archaeon]|nr:hypothetical protein [Candidatus Lokiarchaeota archaeon]
MELNVSLFCSLARQSYWNEWLSDYDVGLHSFLKSALKKGGCRHVRQCMIRIMEEIKKRGDGRRLAAFLIRKYPSLIKNRFKSVSHISSNIDKKFSDINKVFSFYNRHILTFPHRMIICDDDKNQLMHKIESFSKDKRDVDYVIVDGCAYLEYFTPETEYMSDSIHQNDREVTLYKQKIGAK